LKGRSVPQAISRRPLTSETRVSSWAIQCEVCYGQISNGTDFSPTTSVSSCHLYSTNAPSSSYYWEHWTYEYPRWIFTIFEELHHKTLFCESMLALSEAPRLN